MLSTNKISILDDFSDAPIGRFPEDGPDNGQRFRLDFLVPGLKQFQTLEIDLDGTEGYGSSFLEESFGGLVRRHGYTAEDLIRRLKFKSEEDESYIAEILEYIQTATPQK